MNDEVQVIQGTPDEVADVEVAEPEIDLHAEIKKLTDQNKKLQASMSRQGWELGELRQKVPALERMAQANLPAPETADFFVDPKKAVDQNIDAHPAIQKLQAEARQLEQQRMVLTLKEAHPDYREITVDEDFIDWVQASKVRTRLFQDANNGYDFDSANELLTTWKERKTIANTSKVEQEQKQKAAADLKSAAVHTGSAVSGKKIYTPKQLEEIKRTDLDTYISLNPAKLYAEGRVRNPR